jgi:hypothetical protein
MLTSRRILLFIIVLIISPLVASAEKDEKKPSPGLNEATLKGLEWRSVGPALTAGRIADIAINHKNRSTWYVGVGSGGVWKTVNRGTTWTPVFDSEGSYSLHRGNNHRSDNTGHCLGRER